MTRLPAGTPYLGPSMCYDDQIRTEDLLRRIVYGKTPPMLGHRQRMDARFYGRLLDNLSNAHVVVVKRCTAWSTANTAAVNLRKELPADLYQVIVDHDKRDGEYNVLALNRIPVGMRSVPVRDTPDGPIWVDLWEAARVLRLSRNRARAVILASGLPIKRVGAIGGYGAIHIRQRDLVTLANRPNRWKKRRKTVFVE